MKNYRTAFLILMTVLVSSLQADITGRIVDNRDQGQRGVVVYDISGDFFEILNNETTLSEHLPRAMSDRNGQFRLESDDAREERLLIGRDMIGRFGLYSSEQADKDSISLRIEEPANLTGFLMAGPDPVVNSEVCLVLREHCDHLRYHFKTKTNQKGRFRFNHVMPGTYSLMVLQDIPAIGCQGSIVTHSKQVKLESAQSKQVQLGGTDYPFLSGTVCSPSGEPMHGVWVQLFRKDPSSDFETQIWADVTDPNGVYSIYDLPPGEYVVQCLRRLAKNTPSRVMEKDLSVEIKKPVDWPGIANNFDAKANKLDIKIDPEPFLPLAIGDDAPNIQVQTLDGKNWSLSEQKGKVVVVHFYKSTSRFCAANFDGFENVQKTFGNTVEVLGICLDKTRDDYPGFLEEKAPSHQQSYETPPSPCAKQFRVADVPTSFVIDQQGKIAQVDLFGATLKKYIQDKLLQ